MKSLYIKQVEAERSRVSRRASASWEEDAEMKALEYVHSLRNPYMIFLDFFL